MDDKQTYFEYHHHQKIFTEKITWVKCLQFSYFSWFLIACLLTVLRSLVVDDFTCFNLSAKLSAVNLFNPVEVKYMSWLGIFSQIVQFLYTKQY